MGCKVVTRKSLRDLERDEFFRRRKRWRERLKPPYRCPKCFNERVVHGKRWVVNSVVEINGKVVYKREFHYRLWCQNGCFNMTFTYTTPVKEFVDAYCELVDYVLGK